jgi:hypothetical protein
VKVVERVLVHQVGFVDEEHWESALVSEVLDVSADRMEDVASGGAVGDVEGVAEVPVEVAPAEGNVVALGQPQGLVGTERVAQGTQHAGLADAGLAGDDSVFSLLDTGDELVNQAALAIGEPKFAVFDLFGKGLTSKTKVVEVGAHDGISLSGLGRLPSV